MARITDWIKDTLRNFASKGNGASSGMVSAAARVKEPEQDVTGDSGSHKVERHDTLPSAQTMQATLNLVRNERILQDPAIPAAEVADHELIEDTKPRLPHAKTLRGLGPDEQTPVTERVPKFADAKTVAMPDETLPATPRQAVPEVAAERKLADEHIPFLELKPEEMQWAGPPPAPKRAPKVAEETLIGKRVQASFEALAEIIEDAKNVRLGGAEKPYFDAFVKTFEHNADHAASAALTGEVRGYRGFLDALKADLSNLEEKGGKRAKELAQALGEAVDSVKTGLEAAVFDAYRPEPKAAPFKIPVSSGMADTVIPPGEEAFSLRGLVENAAARKAGESAAHAQRPRTSTVDHETGDITVGSALPVAKSPYAKLTPTAKLDDIPGEEAFSLRNLTMKMVDVTADAAYERPTVPPAPSTLRRRALPPAKPSFVERFKGQLILAAATLGLGGLGLHIGLQKNDAEDVTNTTQAKTPIAQVAEAPQAPGTNGVGSTGAASYTRAFNSIAVPDMPGAVYPELKREDNKPAPLRQVSAEELKAAMREAAGIPAEAAKPADGKKLVDDTFKPFDGKAPTDRVLMIRAMKAQRKEILAQGLMSSTLDLDTPLEKLRDLAPPVAGPKVPGAIIAPSDDALVTARQLASYLEKHKPKAPKPHK